MSYVLGKPLTAGRFVVRVVSWQVVAGRTIGPAGVAVHCSKTPAYVVVQDGPGRAALDMSGTRVTLKHVQTLCPEVATV